jgi:tetratricopeptide (TPR) repeat protein
MKRIIGIFLLLSTYYVSNAQDNSDSLLKVWNDTSVIDSVRADALKEYIYQKHFRSNVDSAVILAEEHLAFSKKINHSNTILNSYLINSMVNARGGNYDKAIGFSFEALNDTSCEKKWSCQSTFYNVLGNVYTLMNVPKKALVQYRKALNLNIENAGDSTTIGFLYSNIGFSAVFF